MNRRGFCAALAAAGIQQKFITWGDLSSGSLVRLPYLQNMRPDATTILWAMKDPGFGVVMYSADGINFKSVQAGVRLFSSTEVGSFTSFTQFRVDLTGLTPGTDYIYQVFVDMEFIAQGKFRTAGDGPFTFLTFGDTGQITPGQFQIANRIAGEPASFLLHVGDIAYFQGTYKDFQADYFDVYKNIMGVLPFFTCPGNHEYETPDATPYVALHAVPVQNVPVADRGKYYSFDWSNVHFICLDSNTPLQRAVSGVGEMLRWLENDLRATRKFWRVAVWHHTVYASGINDNDPLESLARQYIVPILERYGVQLVLNGHEHSYQRSYNIRRGAAVAPGTGTLYLTSGGGGAQLYPVTLNPLVAFGVSAHHYLKIDVSGTVMSISAIGSDGVTIERFTLRPQPALMDTTGTPSVFEEDSNPAVSLIPSGSNTLIRIRGRSLAAEERFTGTVPAPGDLAGTSVLVNGRPIPLLYVSSTQIWGQLPADVRLPFLLNVTNANGFVETNVS